MRILDLDLDYFVSPIIRCTSDDCSRSDHGCTLWSPKRMRNFLEKHCGLSLVRKTPGAVVRNHKEVLAVWKRLIADGVLTAPFDVCHVDAHDDLGLDQDGGYGAFEVCNELIYRPVTDRPTLPVQHLTSGNFLPYAISYRWISSLTLIRHKEDEIGIPQQLSTGDGQAIRLEPLSIEWEDQSLDNEAGCNEPVVPVYDTKNPTLIPKPFDYVCLSLSPGFAPPAAMKLASNVLLPYLQICDWIPSIPQLS